MKKLQVEFQSNHDGCGLHIFKQLKRTENVALYQRIRINNKTTHSFEVFKVKIVKAGTVFAKGAKPTEEDYESYPGKSAFGRYAWTFNDLHRAEQRFEKIIQNLAAIDDSAVEDELSDGNSNTDTTNKKENSNGVKGKRGRKPVDRSSIKLPKDKFTMKQLEVLNPHVSFGFLYQHLRTLLDVEYKIVASLSGGRGKPVLVYAPIDYVESSENFADSVKKKLNM